MTDARSTAQPTFPHNAVELRATPQRDRLRAAFVCVFPLSSPSGYGSLQARLTRRCQPGRASGFNCSASTQSSTVMGFWNRPFPLSAALGGSPSLRFARPSTRRSTCPLYCPLYWPLDCPSYCIFTCAAAGETSNPHRTIVLSTLMSLTSIRMSNPAITRTPMFPSRSRPDDNRPIPLMWCTDRTATICRGFTIGHVGAIIGVCEIHRHRKRQLIGIASACLVGLWRTGRSTRLRATRSPFS